MLYRLSYVGPTLPPRAVARGRSLAVTDWTDRLILPPARRLERVAGIEPAPSAWKAEVLPLNYTRQTRARSLICRVPHHRGLVEGEGFEPSKA